ncbi:MAG: hypothetical protein V4649_15255 [Bacteroidota bacterium]
MKLMTPEELLKTIKEMSGRSTQFSPKSISIDTLMLATRASEPDLIDAVDKLAFGGHIIYHRHASNQATTKSVRLDSVSLA